MSLRKATAWRSMKLNTRIGEKKMTDYRLACTSKLPITDNNPPFLKGDKGELLRKEQLSKVIPPAPFTKGGENPPSAISRRSLARGFTILELLAVVFIISLIAAIAIPRYQRAILKAREAALKQNLHVMRSVIDQYFADKKRYPESLEALVEGGYLRSVPADPFTESSSTWLTIPPESNPFGPPGESGGVYDVKSGAAGVGTNNVSYSEW